MPISRRTFVRASLVSTTLGAFAARSVNAALPAEVFDARLRQCPGVRADGVGGAQVESRGGQFPQLPFLGRFQLNRNHKTFL